METPFSSDDYKLRVPIWHNLFESNDKLNAINFNMLANHVSLHGRLALTIIFTFPPHPITTNRSVSKGKLFC